MATSNPLNIPDARKNIKNTPSTMSIHPNIWSALSTVVLLYGDDEPGLVISYLFAVATTTTNHFFLLLGASCCSFSPCRCCSSAFLITLTPPTYRAQPGRSMTKKLSIRVAATFSPLLIIYTAKGSANKTMILPAFLRPRPSYCCLLLMLLIPYTSSSLSSSFY
jgi:hypothetical protein